MRPKTRVKFSCGCWYDRATLPKHKNGRKVKCPEHHGYMQEWTVECIDCGTIMEFTSPPGAVKRCPSCRPKAHRDQSTKWHKTNAAKDRVVRRSYLRGYNQPVKDNPFIKVDKERLAKFILEPHHGSGSCCRECERERLDKNGCPECPRKLGIQKPNEILSEGGYAIRRMRFEQPVS